MYNVYNIRTCTCTCALYIEGTYDSGTHTCSHTLYMYTVHGKYGYSTLALKKEREIVKEETALRKEKEAVCCYEKEAVCCYVHVHVYIHVHV